jgi:hypothetical protein
MSVVGAGAVPGLLRGVDAASDSTPTERGCGLDGVGDGPS